jgi:methionine synthase I (cobalamin-dependent)/5,10-methylenetetrahydrofolate reductase
MSQRPAHRPHPIEGALPLRRLLSDGGVHVMDGAMGTVLYERGFFVNVCYDELNLTEPRLVEGIHREYVEAGAELIETNTFGANPVKLSSFGLEAKTREINAAAARLARRAVDGAGAHALILGAMGPLGIRIEPWGPTSEAEAQGYFAPQVQGLLEGGVDGFLLETFQDLNELRQAFLAIRSQSELPVLAQVTVEEGGRTAYGTDVETVARTLESWGVDAVGLNCSVGPAEILEAIERMAAATTLPLLAQPNAGLPRKVGDRKMYLASPEYMARYARRMVDAGVRFVGGCCGTTPEHIRRMRESLLGADPGVASADPVPAPLSPPLSDPVALRERSPLGRRLAEGRFVTSVELIPPRGWDVTTLLSDARRIRLAGVDMVSIPDTPRGLSRMGSLPAATLVSREVGLEVVAHYACRDRNMLGMISDLLGAAAAGVRNVLVVTGDLSPAGPYPDHTAVFDIDSIGLTNVLSRLNHGIDPGGHPVEPATEFVIGVALNPGAADAEREARRFQWKLDAGAEFVITQPVFEGESLRPFRAPGSFGPVPILVGLWPLASLRNAEFLANEVPGVRVPESVLARMRDAEAQGGSEAAAEEGVRIAVEAFDALCAEGSNPTENPIQGVHITPPRGRLDLALRLLDELRPRLRDRGVG